MYHVLVLLDGDDMLISTLERVLRRYNYKAGSATKIEDGVKYVKKHKPDIAFVNMYLPVMGSVEAVRRIKEADPKIKVILFSDGNTCRSVKEARKLGISSCLDMPFALKDLKKALKKAEKEIEEEKESA